MGKPVKHTRIVELLEQSRWEQTNGKPVCPRCFDGNDVRPDSRRQNSQVAGSYCNVCDYRFNVLTGTVLERTLAPLSVWAGLALLIAQQHAVVSALPGYDRLTVNNRRQINAMWQKVQQDRAFFERWGERLIAEGFGRPRLQQAPKRKR